MTTIIVSPTARPRPIISAEKMPAEAVGTTIRIAVCQRLAPSASEPTVSESGTFESASSEMVKIIGITAKPIMKPTTSELRCSKLAPVTCGHHSRKSPTLAPVAGSATTNNTRSTTGPSCHDAHSTKTRSGKKTRNSCPGAIRRRTWIGSKLQP